MKKAGRACQQFNTEYVKNWAQYSRSNSFERFQGKSLSHSFLSLGLMPTASSIHFARYFSGSTPFALAVCTRLNTSAVDSAPSAFPEKRKFFLAITKGLTARSEIYPQFGINRKRNGTYHLLCLPLRMRKYVCLNIDGYSRRKSRFVCMHSSWFRWRFQR